MQQSSKYFANFFHLKNILAKCKQNTYIRPRIFSSQHPIFQFSSKIPNSVGIIGLGAMGSPMATNLMSAGFPTVVYDLDNKAVENIVSKGGVSASSPKEVAKLVDRFIITMVPNGQILKKVVSDPEIGFLKDFKGIHICCSTVHPDEAREIAQLHENEGASYVGAPIFARADGVAAKLASFVVGGKKEAVKEAMAVLEANSNGIFVFGEDPGAGNVVKICGNFLIASSIESCSEAISLAEKNGLDRQAVMKMLNTTIFDCLIFKGYGDRIAARSHVPGEDLVGPGFQLDLGLKDVTLALDVAHKVQSPMPFASVLHDRYLGAQAKGRGKMDWSAIGLSVSEEAGINVDKHIPDWAKKEKK